ncbi:MAG: serine/threonine protein kinase [Myxococcales bacterium]|nr:serine/threonine protein kinase [Myxococcales bacterium]
MLGRTFAGRFVVLSKLGAGAMGAVYRARQETVGRDVALKIVRPDKVYDPDTRARFEREARAMSALTSPHTVTAFDFGASDDGAWFLAMELLDGETLGARLKRGAIGVVDAVRLVREALESLAEAHAKGIVHRDLKPDNLFLTRTPDGRREVCKVLDFGIAKLLRDELAIDALETQAGTVFGTPRYMSPEQAQGKPLDARSDLYSLGVILYHALAGRAPFVDDDAVVVMARHIKEAPPRLSEVAPAGRISPTLERVVSKAVEKDPAARFQSAEEFSRALEGALGDALATGSHSASWVATPGPTKQRSRAVWIFAAIVLALVVIPTALWLTVRSTAASNEPANVAAVASDPEPLASVEAVVSEEPAEVASSPEAAPASAPSASVTQPAHAKPRISPKPVAAPPVKRKSGDRYGRFE